MDKSDLIIRTEVVVQYTCFHKSTVALHGYSFQSFCLFVWHICQWLEKRKKPTVLTHQL